MVRRTKELEVVNGVVGRTCSKCREWKSTDEFHKDPNTRAGIVSRCKPCRNATEKVLRKQRSKLYPNNINGDLQKCSICEKEKPLHEFSKNKKYEKGIQTRCKNCMSESKRKWKEKNKEHAQNYNKEWLLNNPDKAKAAQERRKNRLKTLKNQFALKDKVKTLSYFDCSCSLSGREDDIELDHVIPVDVGHLGTVYGNMIPLDKKLNRSKCDRNIFTWFAENKERLNLSQIRFDKTIKFLAESNKMTTDEYKKYVYWCHENPIKVVEQMEQQV